jgi:oligosaccharyltransferase complex subunit epsilon
MAQKNRKESAQASPAPAAAPASTFAASHAAPSAGAPARSSSSSSKSSGNADIQEIVQGVWKNYVERTPQRVKLLDTFMAFLVVVGVLQFVYCVIGGNYVS